MDDTSDTERATGVFSFGLEGVEESCPLSSGVTGLRLSEDIKDAPSRKLWLESVGVMDAALLLLPLFCDIERR